MSQVEMSQVFTQTISGINLDMVSANERWHYIVTLSLIG